MLFYPNSPVFTLLFSEDTLHLAQRVVYRSISAWIRVLFTAFIGYFQRGHAFERFSKESRCSLKNKSFNWFCPQAQKNSPKDLECFKTTSWELSTWNWSAGRTSTTEALELKVNVEKSSGLSCSPAGHTAPAHPLAISTGAQLSFNPPEHGSCWAARVWRWELARGDMRTGWEKRLKSDGFYSHGKN